jgi:3-dehydroquinate synthase
MKQLTVELEKSYNIFIENGILYSCGKYIKEVCRGNRIMIISDSNVFPIYGERVVKSLEEEGFVVAVHIFPAGEENKQLSAVSKMMCALADACFSRTDMVAALGGGVCGDMAGFAAAMYMRGIDFVQLSTSLLSDIDSSVGGKTGCDLPNGKNLVGAFHQPKLVLIDPKTLDTLDKRYYNDGMAEAIKHGIIKSKALFESLPLLSNEELIYKSIDIKRAVVEKDEKESGERKLLNFGHTLGHAIEKYYDFKKYSHGEAVGLGMLLITKAAEENGLCEIGLYEQIEAALAEFDLPITCDAAIGDLIPLCLNDKKRRSDKIDLVIASEIGKSFVHSISCDELEDFLRGADEWMN